MQMSLKGTLAKIAGNSFIQKCLERNIEASQYFMGIGSGSELSSSGERAVFDLLKQRYKPPYSIFDVGANRGQFLQLVLDNIGADLFALHCFEPGHGTYKILMERSKDDRRIRL